MEENIRPGWDQYFMDLAKGVALRGSCNRLRVGSVIVDSKLGLVATGYNGAPRGLESCLDVGCLEIHGRCERTLHSEINALIQAARNGGYTVGTTIYVTHRPCYRCSLQIIQAGVSRIIFEKEYTSDNTELFMRIMAESNTWVGQFNSKTNHVAEYL